MPLPSSFKNLGLYTAESIRKQRRLMLGSDGLTNTGKTEFMLSAPGPKIILCVDRSFDSVLDNPNPPASRDLTDAAFDIVSVPNQAGGGVVGSGVNGQFKEEDFKAYFKKYRARLYELLSVSELVTLGIDGDSDSWELQVLADFGKLTQIPPMQYNMTDAARRSMINRCWESCKIIIATNKIKDKYVDLIDPNTGLPIPDEGFKGRNKQKKAEGEYKRQGFRDQDYLWQMQIRHLYKPPVVADLSGLSPIERLKAVREGRAKKSKPEWGLRIMKCKVNPMLEGDELWGSDCNFAGLVQYVYPNVPLEDWGFR